MKNRTYNDLDVSNLSIIYLNPNDRDITINGFCNGISAQLITLVKAEKDNSITLNHENENGIQKIKTSDKSNKSYGKSLLGSISLLCDGRFWYDCSFIPASSLRALSELIIKMGQKFGTTGCQRWK